MGGASEVIQELGGFILPAILLITLGVSASSIFDFLVRMNLASRMSLRADIIGGSSSILSMADNISIDFSWDRWIFAMKVTDDYLAFLTKLNNTIYSAYPNMVPIHGVTPEEGAYYVVGVNVKKFIFQNNGTKEMSFG